MKYLLVASLLALSLAHAETTTPALGPSDCFQVAQTLSIWADGLAGHASAPVTDPGRAARIPRNPRHCYFKARELFLNVQKLRAEKRLAPAAEPPVPAGELKPGDVHAMAALALADLKGLQPTFPAARPPAADASRVDGKKPGDVFYELSDAQLRVLNLGAAAFGPSDCYQMAVSLETALEELRAARKVTTAVGAAQPVTGKKPADCYQQARGLLEDLSKIPLEIPGGVVVVENRTGELKPGHVLEVLSIAAADVNSLKAKAGDLAPFKIAPFEGGKTPSDVFAQIARARHLARSLAAK